MNAKIARLDDRSVLAVSGPDAARFLHDVVTADIAGLGDGEATYSALLTPQGKVLFDFFVVKTGSAFLIDCALEQRGALAQRLTMYKLRSNVELAADDDWAIFAAWECRPETTGIVYADPRDEGLGWRIIGDSVANVDAGLYHARRIGFGIADSVADIGSGEVFPHEANMDQLGAVSFTKGCYIGQEVVSRMQHRGTARNRFVIVSSDSPLEPGAEVTSGGRRIGKVTSVAGHQALALVRIDRVASAVDEGEPLTCGKAEVTATAPPWATFELQPLQDAAR